MQASGAAAVYMSCTVAAKFFRYEYLECPLFIVQRSYACALLKTHMRKNGGDFAGWQEVDGAESCRAQGGARETRTSEKGRQKCFD